MSDKDITVSELVLSVKNLAKTRAESAQGASFFILAEDVDKKDELVSAIMELKYCMDGPNYGHSRVTVLDVTSQLESMTLERLLFPKNNHPMHMKDFYREQDRKNIGRVLLIDNAQDLTMNAKRTQQFDMALVRGLSSRPHNRVVILVGTKSIMKMVALDERLGQKSLCLKLV